MEKGLSTMERAIITPTYKGHFKYIKNYLESFQYYSKNKNFPICFIIERSEAKLFKKIINPYINQLNINIFYLEDIFEKYNIKETPQEILKKYGRLSFQTIKKFYGGLYSGAEQFLLLDSESMLIKPIDINEIFDVYFKNPYFYISRCNDRHDGFKQSFVYNYVKTASKILNIQPEYWSVESYEWIYEKRILEDLIRDLGQPIDIIKSVTPSGKFQDLEGVLEALLYYLYIYKNNNKYKYSIYIVQDDIKAYFGKDRYIKFREAFDSNKCLNVTGLYESCTYYINNDNMDNFINLFNDRDVYIMRFLAPNNNYCSQKHVIENTKICILPSEQEHLFGINVPPFRIWSYNHGVIEYYLKVVRHFNKISKRTILELFITMFYLIVLILKGSMYRNKKGKYEKSDNNSNI